MKAPALTNSVDMEVCVDKIGGRFDLIILAAQRAREIKRGSAKLVPSPNGAIVSALQEVEAGLVGKEYLLKIPSREKFEKK